MEGYMSSQRWLVDANRFAVSSPLPVKERLAKATGKIGQLTADELPTEGLQDRFRQFKNAVTSGVATDMEAQALLAEMFDIFAEASTHSADDETDGPVII